MKILKTFILHHLTDILVTYFHKIILGNHFKYFFSLDEFSEVFNTYFFVYYNFFLKENICFDLIRLVVFIF